VDARRAQATAELASSAGVDDELPEGPGEFEEQTAPGSAEKPRFMRGRLRAKYAFWASFCRNKLVLAWILTGFVLLWRAGPPAPSWQANHGSARQHAQFVGEAIRELVQSGTAIAVTERPHCVLPLGVVVRAVTGKKRLILDARSLNDHVVTPSFKYETLTGLRHILLPHDHAFTTDLKSGYHHVDVNEEFWTYLGFEWEGQFYVFTQLPFGLAPACWAFTKVTRELLTKWRSEGMRNSGYLDDAIHAAQSAATLIAMRARVLSDFERAGFIVNIAKCALKPSQCVAYLGALVNTADGTITVPIEKREALLRTIESCRTQATNCHMRVVASLVGTIMSMSYSFGELSMVMTRRLVQWQNAMYAQGHTLNHHVPLDAGAIGELEFWSVSFREFDGRRPLWPPGHLHTLKIFTDAAGHSPYSNGGWGGWLAVTGTRMAAGRWEMVTFGLSSGYLEMRAILNVILSINRDGRLDQQRVLLHTDSQVAFAVLNKWGSVVVNIQDVCFELFWYCLRRGISLVPTWIPRELNTLADKLSKRDDTCDWKLLPSVFQQLAAMWGPFTVDLFASDTNCQFSPFTLFTTRVERPGLTRLPTVGRRRRGATRLLQC
jgi:ribonuclease HI